MSTSTSPLLRGGALGSARDVSYAEYFESSSSSADGALPPSPAAVASRTARCTLDVFVPQSSSSGCRCPLRPTVLFVHGGGWQRGSKRTALGVHQNIGRSLSAKGFVVVAPNYRLSSMSATRKGFYCVLSVLWMAVLAAGLHFALERAELPGVLGDLSHYGIVAGAAFALALAAFVVCIALRLRASTSRRGGPHLHPAHTLDCAAALRWTIANAAAYGGDGTRIVLVGHSAGAHIAAMLLADDAMLSHDAQRTIIGLVGVSGPYSSERFVDPTKAAALRACVRCWFLTPSFGDGDLARAFPVHLVREKMMMRMQQQQQQQQQQQRRLQCDDPHLKLGGDDQQGKSSVRVFPPTLLLSGQCDFPTLSSHAADFRDALNELGELQPGEAGGGEERRELAEEHVVCCTNHFSIMFGLGFGSCTRAERSVAPLIVRFIERCSGKDPQQEEE